MNARQVRTATHDEYLLGWHSAAFHCDLPIRLVGRDAHVCRIESPPFEATQEPVPDVASAKLGLVELGIDIVVVKYKALAEQLEESRNQENRVRRIAAMDDVKAPCESHPNC